MLPISPLSVGEPAPWFSAATGSKHIDTVAFDELAGRYIVLFFFGTAARPDVAEVLAAFRHCKNLFDYKRALFLGLTAERCFSKSV
jgi:peroxiredoxin